MKDRVTAEISRIQRFSVDDGPGIRTTVFFQGCNLRCKWCHNPECIGFEKTKDTPITRVTMMTPEQLLEEVTRDKPFYAASGGGVTLSGGEPLLRPDFVMNFLEKCASAGLHTAVDTAGLVPWETLKAAAQNSSLLLYDLKAVSEGIHREATGSDNALILENLERLDSLRSPVLIRVPVIPGINTGSEMKKIAAFSGRLRHITRVELLPYHRLGAAKYRELGIEYPLARLREPTEKMMRLQYSYFSES